MKSKGDLPVLVDKADRKFRISPIPYTSLAGDRKKLIVEHAVGRHKAVTINEAMKFLGLRDAYIAKQQEIRRKWKNDDETFNLEDAMWLDHFQSQTKGAFNRVTRIWKEFYEGQDLLPCAAWVPTGDKEIGSVFAIWAMITVSSRRLAVGSDKDYAQYVWMIKRKTQGAADRNVEVTQDIHEYLKMGHAGKDVAYFLGQLLKGNIPQKPPPALGFGADSK